MLELECQGCGFEGSEDVFKHAERIELRHEIGDRFSNKECPKCGALAYPGSAGDRYIVVHQHEYGVDVHQFTSVEAESIVTSPDAHERIVDALSIDFEPQLHEDLLVVRLDSTGVVKALEAG